MQRVPTTRVSSGAVGLAGRWGRRAWAIGVLANAATLGLVGCGEGGGAATGERVEVSVDVHPDAMGSDAAPGEPSDAERALLLRARGREWVDRTGEQLERFLRPGGDTARALLVWDPRAETGAEGLWLASLALARLHGDGGAETAVAVRAGGDRDDELVALRASRVALPAFRIPADAYPPARGRGTVVVASQPGGGAPAVTEVDLRRAAE